MNRIETNDYYDTIGALQEEALRLAKQPVDHVETLRLARVLNKIIMENAIEIISSPSIDPDDRMLFCGKIAAVREWESMLANLIEQARKDRN